MLIISRISYYYFSMKSVMSLPTSKIIPLLAKVVDPTSTPSHCSKSLGYDCRIMPFIDVEAKECIEHVSDREEGMEDGKGSYANSMHGYKMIH